MPGARDDRSGWTRWPAAACVALAAAAMPSGAAEVQAMGARVAEVTVYPDRAEVVREAAVDVPTGSSRVVFSGLPVRLEPDSIQVSARGVPAAIGSVQIEKEARDPERTAELIAAEREVQRIEEDLAAIGSEQGVAERLRKFLGSIEATTATRVGRELGEGFTDPNSLAAVFDLLEGGHERIAREELERRMRTRDLQKELEVARARLEAVRPRGPIRFVTASVEIEAERAGRVTMRLSYLSPGASWRPAYRARLDADGGEVEWIAEAVVRQQTGEDWTGVDLGLSTAAPARGVSPPELRPWFLRPVEPRADVRGRGALAQKSSVMMEEMDAAAPAGAFADEAEAMYRGAAITRSAYNVAFSVPGKTDVPSDGREHRARLRSDKLPAELSYKAVPPGREAAFLIARTTSPAEYPLLAGPVRIFAGGAFLGAYTAPEAGPGSELEIPFGEDNRVKIERIRLPQERSREGFTGRDRQVAFAWRTSIENLRDRPVEIVVEDRVPRSEDERIRVRTLEQTTPGYEEDRDRPGILIWTLTVPPRGKEEITLEYSVRFPRDLVVPGI